MFCQVDFVTAPPSGPDPRAMAMAHVELLEYAEKLRKQNQPGPALELLDQILLIDPKLVAAWVARGKCFALLGNMVAAAQAARSALEVQPTHAEAKTLHDTWARAVAAMPAAAMRDAAESVARAAKEAHEHLDAGRDADALALFDALVANITPARRDAPELASLHTSRGVALQRLRRLPEALAAFAEALRVNARYALAWQNQASALDDAGRVKEAALSAERAVELDASRANAWVDLGYYRKKLGQLRQAKDAYQQALAIDAHHPAALLNLGNVFAEEGALDAAERAYRAAISASPGFTLAKDALARVLSARQQRGNAPALPAGLPFGRPFKTALERASSNTPADNFFTHALLILRSGEIASASHILAVGWISGVPGLPGAELLTDIIVKGPRAYACRSAQGAQVATVETIGRVDLFAARELLGAGTFEEVVWVVDADPSSELMAAIAEAERVVGRAGVMRVLRIATA